MRETHPQTTPLGIQEGIRKQMGTLQGPRAPMSQMETGTQRMRMQSPC